MLDAVVQYLPSPLDIDKPVGYDPHDPSEEIPLTMADDQPLLGSAFKIANDSYIDKLTFFCVYSGTLKSGSYVFNNISRDKKSRTVAAHACQLP
ncbi:MAG: hypothetical protein Kow0042_23570 [Calditrichia bacterium]